MSEAEKRALLLGLQGYMAQVQQVAERIAGAVLALEAGGIELPSMKQTARILAEVALGWEAGDGV